jgi:hypothetical protein
VVRSWAMPRFFNTAGPCNPERHYMLLPERRLPDLRILVDREQYFVVHAPRQSGKTTAVRAFAEQLTAEGRHTVVYATCEEAQAAGGDLERGVSAVLAALARQADRLPPALRAGEVAAVQSSPAETRLTDFLTRWSESSPRPVVLFLDEIDALRDETLLTVLRQLRAGYPERPARFPASVALIGLRDVRDYRISSGADDESGAGRRRSLGTSSPFNVKVRSLTLDDFTAEEVAALYGQHTAETGQRFEPEAMALAWTLTHGQPWLVNALAAEVVERLVPDRRIDVAALHIERAKEILVERRDTHLDSLIDRLREPRVRRVLEPILAGTILPPDLADDDLQYAMDLGLVTSGAAGLEIANPIYREVIPRALTWVVQETLPLPRAPSIAPDGTLLFDRLIADFRAFWREHAEAYLARQPYSEAAAQLVFMAFLQKLVNGGGFIDREYGVGRGRIDLCVRWTRVGGVQRWAVELKVWRDGRPDPLPEGLRQLAGYLERLGLDE